MRQTTLVSLSLIVTWRDHITSMHKVCSQSRTGIKPIVIGLWDQHLATWPSCLILCCTDGMETAICLYHFNRSSMKQIWIVPKLVNPLVWGVHLHQCIKFAARHERGIKPAVFGLQDQCLATWPSCPRLSMPNDMRLTKFERSYIKMGRTDVHYQWHEPVLRTIWRLRRLTCSRSTFASGGAGLWSLDPINAKHTQSLCYN